MFLANNYHKRFREDSNLKWTRKLEGIINLVPSSVCTLYIGGRKFNISSKLLLSLRDGEHYTAYYAPKSGILLAIEPSLPLAQVKGKRKLTLGDDGEFVPLNELADDHTDSPTERGNRT